MAHQTETTVRRPREGRIEWPTLAVAAALYGAFGLVTWFHAALPWWLLLPLGAYLVAWHGSLQHEVAHGHPSPWPPLNEALVLPSLWLWLPFRLYRESHLRHHRDENLTDPELDPESTYLTAEAWARLPTPARVLHYLSRTVAGRLLLGPLVCIARVWSAEARRLLAGDASTLGAWLRHGLGCALVIGWIVGACGMSLVEYILLFAYPGLALTLLRSYLEHRARPAVAERSAVVEAGPVMSLLYLNNNLHALHHAEPGLPWYRLPARYRETRAALLAANGGYRVHGYGEVVLRYLLWPKEPPVHPFEPGVRAAEAPAPTAPAVVLPERAL